LLLGKLHLFTLKVENVEIETHQKHQCMLKNELQTPVFQRKISPQITKKIICFFILLLIEIFKKLSAFRNIENKTSF
jgi:hypothetical protein